MKKNIFDNEPGRSGVGHASTFAQEGFADNPMPAETMSQGQWDRQDYWPIDTMTTWTMPAVTARDALKTVAAVYQSGARDLDRHITQIRTLVKSTGIYAIASIVPSLSSLVIPPMVTHYVTQRNYGMLTIVSTVVALVAGISQLGLHSAFFRAYNYDYTTREDRDAVLATTMGILLLVSIPLTIGVILCAPFLAHLMFPHHPIKQLVIIAGVGLFLHNLAVPGYAWLRAEDRPFFYAFLAIGSVAATLLGMIVLVAVLHLGIVGVMWSHAAGTAFVVVCTVPLIVRRAGIRIRPDVARSMLTFGLPMMLSFVAYWTLQSSDRYLLGRLGSLEQTGMYNVAHSLGSIVATAVITPFTLIWPTLMFDLAKRADAPRIFRLVFRWYSLLLLFAAYALSLLGTILLNQLYSAAYQPGRPIIPLVSASVVFLGIYHIFTTGVNLQRKTLFMAMFSTLAALVNCGANVLLIPRYQAMGAALSTLLAVIVMAAIAYIVNLRLYPVRFEVGGFSIGLLIGVGFYLGADLIALHQDFYTAWSIRFAALCLYGVCLFLLAKRLEARAQ